MSDKSVKKQAEDEFRSLNGQIEFLLNEYVKNRRKKSGGHIIEQKDSEEINK